MPSVNSIKYGVWYDEGLKHINNVCSLMFTMLQNLKLRDSGKNKYRPDVKDYTSQASSKPEPIAA